MKTKSMSLNELLDRIKLRVVDNTADIKYYGNKKPSASDTLEFLQAKMNDGGILEMTEDTINIAESLFKQGLIFRHSRKAIEKDKTVYSRTEEKLMKEMADACDCPECQEERRNK